MAKERTWWMEWLINQPLHFVMGFVLAGGVTWGLHYTTHLEGGWEFPWYITYPVGILVSRVVWMLREMRQKNWQYIVWSNRDLGFIDAGIVASVITLLLLGNTV